MGATGKRDLIVLYCSFKDNCIQNNIIICANSVKFMLDSNLCCFLHAHFLSLIILVRIGDQYVIESDGLLIKSVEKKDAGTYTCRARVPQTGELEERDVRLDVS